MNPVRSERWVHLLAQHKGLEPLSVAVVHPCDESSIAAANHAVNAGMIRAILVGPLNKIRAVAQLAGVDLGRFEIEDVPHSHAAAARAVALVRESRANALMKGSLHTDELMGAVVAAEAGLRTERRMSHCFVMDLPGRAQPLIITDAAINIQPTLQDKADIAQNAIDLGHALRFGEVRVAVLSATETVNPRMPSTLEAAALCKMADRGQITGAEIDGPLALDNAIDLGAAQLKRIDSTVAGRANVLLVPDLNAGNMLAKSLSFLAHAEAAGIALGARVPVILTSRADSMEAHLSSCAVAAMWHDWQIRKARRDPARTGTA